MDIPAACKCSITDRFQRVRQHDRVQILAAVEGIVLDGCHPLRNVDGMQIAAFCKCPLPDLRQCCIKDYLIQIVALRKCICTHARHCLRQRQVMQVITIVKQIIRNLCNA